MRLIRHILLVAVGIAWVAYLLAAFAGLELASDRIRGAVLAIIVSATVTAGVAVVLRLAVRRVLAELARAVQLGRQLERTRSAEPARVVPLHPTTHSLPTQYRR